MLKINKRKCNIYELNQQNFENIKTEYSIKNA